MAANPALLAEIYGLARSAQSLAGIGAWLRLQRSGAPVDEQVRRRLDAYVAAILPEGVRPSDEDAAALDFVDLFFEEAAELVRFPDRPAGEGTSDPRLMRAQATLSRQSFHAILALAVDRPDLDRALDGRFLDVGTGAGGYALEAVATRPGLTAVGIDIWPPALGEARAAAEASPARDRVEFRELDVRALEEADEYTVAWVPTSHLSREVLGLALDRLLVALRAGGVVVLGFPIPPTEPVSRAFAELRLARDGGDAWTSDLLEPVVREHGFVDVESVEPFPGVGFVLGRRPASP